MSVIKAKRHTAKSEFEQTFSLFYADSRRLLSKVPKRRKRFICPKIVWLNNSIYNDLMIIQINLFAKQEERKIEKLNRIKSALEKIESLEKAIMVYSNIMANNTLENKSEKEGIIMKYYKVINGQIFVGIATTSELRKIQLRHNILISCTEKEAECIQVEDKYYHAGWMKAVREDVGAITADVIEISKEEYDELYEMIERDEEITPTPEPEPTPEPTPDEQEQDVTVDYAKKLKLKEMSNTCENLIFSGIDVMLSDGVSHHFSLTEYDQLNLFKLETLARSGEMEVLPYHEDDKLCQFFPAQDIITIANAAANYITYHTTYFNSLKAYIKSLRSINTISKVRYGMDIPERYQSDVWKEINKDEES